MTDHRSLPNDVAHAENAVRRSYDAAAPKAPSALRDRVLAAVREAEIESGQDTSLLVPAEQPRIRRRSREHWWMSSIAAALVLGVALALFNGITRDNFAPAPPSSWMPNKQGLPKNSARYNFYAPALPQELIVTPGELTMPKLWRSTQPTRGCDPRIVSYLHASDASPGALLELDILAGAIPAQVRDVVALPGVNTSNLVGFGHDEELPVRRTLVEADCSNPRK